ncbi:MAG TPA: aspartate kinase [Firmicutes bacterium]|nr:aspartate kinase [Candidatus Fermentithermobacillaceae bacterium]
MKAGVFPGTQEARELTVVQKFGGTCLDTKEKRQLACDRIQEALDNGFRVLAVVSAMGRRGEPYATDTLIALAKGISKDIAPRESDLLLSCGEIISAVLMVQELKTRNIPAMALSGGQAGILTDTNFGDARIVAINSTHVKRHLDEGKVVVVAGFQGMAESGDITTLGRGGSDTTAAALGGALSARCVEIYTDVEGIMTADPKMVRSAKTIPFVTYDEVVHLALEGAKVIHPLAVQIARKAQIPVRVRSLSADSRETVIGSGEDRETPWLFLRNDNPVTGITYVSGLAHVVLNVCPADQMKRLTGILHSVADISLDVINVFPDRLSFAIGEDLVEELLSRLGHMRNSADIQTGKAKVTVIGHGMHGRAGVMSNVAIALAQEDIRIFASSDSNITISCLIEQDCLHKAVNALHDAFGL